MPDLSYVLEQLKELDRKNDDVRIPDLDILARRLKNEGILDKNENLVRGLWNKGGRTNRRFATRIVDSRNLTEDIIDKWVTDLDSWDLCDAFAASMVRPTQWVVSKCHEWPDREPEFERRAAFSTMALLAWQKNDHADDVFLDFLPLIEKYANDDRYYVKKAVNWALRDIGKRNQMLRSHALSLSERLQVSNDKTARWVGSHRIKEIISSI